MSETEAVEGVRNVYSKLWNCAAPTFRSAFVEWWGRFECVGLDSGETFRSANPCFSIIDSDERYDDENIQETVVTSAVFHEIQTAATFSIDWRADRLSRRTDADDLLLRSRLYLESRLCRRIQSRNLGHCGGRIVYRVLRLLALLVGRNARASEL